jgi:ribonuclease R
VTDLPQDVKRHLAESKHPLGIKELLRLTGLHPGQQTWLKRTLRDLVREGALLKEGKRFRLQQGRPAVEQGQGGAHAPFVRRQQAQREARGGGGWREKEGQAHGILGPGVEGPLEAPRQAQDERFAPRSRFDRGARPDPRGRFMREGKVEQPPAGPRGRFQKEGRPELVAPRGPAGSKERFERGGGRPERGGRFERGGQGARGGPFQRGPGRSGREERFERGGRAGGGGRGRGWEEGVEYLTVEGILHVHRDGYGFVHPSSGEGDNIFLPPDEAARALDNDRVVVEARGRPGRMEGRLVRVRDRVRQLVVGTYTEQGKRNAFVVPYDKNLQTQGPIRVPRTQMARDGDVVKVRLGVGAELLEPGEGLYGEVAGSVGRPGDPSAEVLSIAYSQGFSDEFPSEVMDEADRVRPVVSEEEALGEERRDLRTLPLITIDGEDARDFDDAVHAETHPQGWRLVVAIADVTHYVREGSALDAEALRRATSVYLPDRVLPMLPERLSNGICSLRPDEDRLCMVADMVLDRSGKLVSSELYPGVMRSHARCTYNEVQDVLDGKDVPHRNAFRPHFERLMALARVLTKMRKERGAIDFNLPEHKVVLDEQGNPSRMERRERKDSHRLIEECMLAANEAVARFFREAELPSVYRYHGEPDEEKLAVFAQLAQAYGFQLRPDQVSPKELNAFMTQLQGHPEERALNQLLLRSMMQAVYTASDVGHYGLAAEYYLHFTSPIRRYPDLLVHRLLKAHWARSGEARSPAQLEREELRLEDMAVQSSERERAAMQVEREVVSFYAVLMMKDRIGEEFDATVASVVDFGFFVELDEVHVEGLVRADTFGPGARFDKATHAFVLSGGRRVKVGQKLRVRLANVNLALRRIDFEPLAFEGEARRSVAAESPAAEVDRRVERQLRRRGRLEQERRPVEAVAETPAPVLASVPAPSDEQEAPSTVERQGEAPVEELAPPAAPPVGFERIRALASGKKQAAASKRPVAAPKRRKVAEAEEPAARGRASAKKAARAPAKRATAKRTASAGGRAKAKAAPKREKASTRVGAATKRAKTKTASPAKTRASGGKARASKAVAKTRAKKVAPKGKGKSKK